MFSKKYGVATLSFLSSNKKIYGVEALPDINKYRKSYSLQIQVVSPFKSASVDYDLEVSVNSRHKAVAYDIHASGVRNMTADSKLGGFMIESAAKRERVGTILTDVSAQRPDKLVAHLLDAVDALHNTQAKQATIQTIQTVSRISGYVGDIVASQLSRYVDERDAEILWYTHHLKKEGYFDTISIESDATNEYRPSEYKIDIVTNDSAMRLVRIIKGDSFTGMMEAVAHERMIHSQMIADNLASVFNRMLDAILEESSPFQSGGIPAYMPELFTANRMNYMRDSSMLKHQEQVDRRHLLEWLQLHEPDMFDRVVLSVDSRYAETDWGLKPRTVESTWWTSDFTYASYRVPEFDARYTEADLFNRSADMVLKYSRGEYAADYDRFVRHNVERWSVEPDFHLADLVLFGGEGVMISDPHLFSRSLDNEATLQFDFTHGVHNMEYGSTLDAGFTHAEHTHWRDATMVKDADEFTYAAMTDAVISEFSTFTGTGIPAYLPEIHWGVKLSPDAITTIEDYTDFTYSSMQDAVIDATTQADKLRLELTTQLDATEFASRYQMHSTANTEYHLGYRDDIFDAYAIEISTDGRRVDEFDSQIESTTDVNRVTTFDSLTLREDQYGSRVRFEFETSVPQMHVHQLVPREFDATNETIDSTTGNVSQWSADIIDTTLSDMSYLGNFAYIDDITDTYKVQEHLTELSLLQEVRRIDDRNFGVMAGFTDAIDNGLLVYMHELDGGTRHKQIDALLELTTPVNRSDLWSAYVSSIDMSIRSNNGIASFAHEIEYATRFNDRGVAVQPDMHLGVHDMTYEAINDEHFDLFGHDMTYESTMVSDPHVFDRRIFERPSTVEEVDLFNRRVRIVDSDVIYDTPTGVRINEQYAQGVLHDWGKFVPRTFETTREQTSTGYRSDEWLTDISVMSIGDKFTTFESHITDEYLGTRYAEYASNLIIDQMSTRVNEHEIGTMADMTEGIDSGTIVYLHEGDVADMRQDNNFIEIIEYVDSIRNSTGYGAEVITTTQSFKVDEWRASIADFRPTTLRIDDYIADVADASIFERVTTWERVELTEGQGTARVDEWVAEISESQLSELDKDLDAVLQLMQLSQRDDNYSATILDALKFDRRSVWDSSILSTQKSNRVDVFDTSVSELFNASIDREWYTGIESSTLSKRSDEWLTDLDEYVQTKRSDEWRVYFDEFEDTHRVNEWDTELNRFTDFHRVDEWLTLVDIFENVNRVDSFTTELITTQLTERASYKPVYFDEFIKVKRQDEWDATIEQFTDVFGPDDREYTWLWHSTPYAWSKWNWYKTK